jgi:spore maturation protein CgeB
MKILFVGSLAVGQTSRMRMEALQRLGHSVRGVDSAERWRSPSPLARRLQQASCVGKVVASLNADVIAAAGGFKPDMLWAEKQEYLRPTTLARLRRDGIRLLHFTPDPYFSLKWKRTRLMDRAISLFDCLVTSKRYELVDYRRLGTPVYYMPLGFDEAVHKPVTPASRQDFANYESDVSFLGGWEPRRERALDIVSRLSGVSLRIWGYGWDHVVDGRLTPRRLLAMRRNAGGQAFSITHKERLAASVQGNEVYGCDYARALSGARIGLGFLRTICDDQHTTRTFEIPACGSMLLADRTEEHREFFAEGVEADFFSSDAEMLDKIDFYLRNEKTRARVAARGFDRCHRSGYSYTARMSALLNQLES